MRSKCGAWFVLHHGPRRLECQRYSENRPAKYPTISARSEWPIRWKFAGIPIVQFERKSPSRYADGHRIYRNGVAIPMSYQRFSVRSLMVFVVVSAVGLAALRSANEIWASVMLLIAFGASATPVVNALILRGTERYGWTGFAIFSGGYLGITLGPLLNTPYNSHLGTTAALNYVQSQVAFASPSQPMAARKSIIRRASLVQRIATLEERFGRHE